MDRYESAALLDFVNAIVWPTRTLRVVTAPGGETQIDVNSPAGGWNTTLDIPMAWINGNRVAAAVTWVSGTRIQLPVTATIGQQVIIFITPGAGTGYLARNGLVAMTGSLDMGGQRVRNVGASVNASDAVRRDEVIAIATALLGGNYLLLTGGTMSGDITLPATAVGSLGANQAARKALVALLDASQDFTGKIKAPSTVDSDPATTLATKDWVLAKVAGASPATAIPYQGKQDTTTPGTYVTGFTVPALVTALWVQVRGAGGGAGAGSSSGGRVGGAGGFGGMAYAKLTVTPGQVLQVIVGGGGGGGITSGYSSSGGGGGGMSQITGTGISVTAGGGGGGGAARSNGGASDGNGGPGGTAGNAGQDGIAAAGAAGSGGTTAGGSGGASVTGTLGGAGGNGTSVISGANAVDNSAQDYLHLTNTFVAGGAGVTNSSGIAGSPGTVTIRW